MREEAEEPITRHYLESLHIGSGYSAWSLAEDLENFLEKYSDDIYDRCEAWCGGARMEMGLSYIETYFGNVRGDLLWFAWEEENY